MKENFKGISWADLCSWFGVTRQAYSQSKNRVLIELIEQEILIAEISTIRKDHKRLGGRKLFFMLEGFMKDHHIKMGRDAFFDFLRDHHLLIKQRKRYHVTTNSNHWMKKYPNLIKDLEPLGPSHIWVSDITYWKTKAGHFYISFITDAYSRKIVGYHVADTMEAVESVVALKMALKELNQEVTGLPALARLCRVSSMIKACSPFPPALAPAIARVFSRVNCIYEAFGLLYHFVRMPSEPYD